MGILYVCCKKCIRTQIIIKFNMNNNTVMFEKNMFHLVLFSSKLALLNVLTSMSLFNDALSYM